MSEIRHLPYAPIEELVLDLLAVEPTEHRTAYGDGGLQGSIAHELTFASYVTREQVEDYLKRQHYFGYDPAGYGGVLKPHGQQAGMHWSYEHSRTTGD